MGSMRTGMGRAWLAAVVLGAVVLMAGMGSQVQAAEQVISTAVTAPCPFSLTLPVGTDLRITSMGSITCNDNQPGDPPGADARDITITLLGGSMVMEAGSGIFAENNNNGGDGGKITLTVSGDLTLEGNGVTGATISSRKNSGAGDTGTGGDIRITVGNVTVNPVTDDISCGAAPVGDILMQQGAQILADANGKAGSIKMFAGKNATIDGLVSSEGKTSQGRGGPITIDACCDLLIDVHGHVVSKGTDPGADLVHLQGCAVTILGLVESTGAGHKQPPANLCVPPNRPGKPTNSTGCVEIWSGTTILIDATGTNNGEVNVDIGTSADPLGRGWADILAHGNITIKGDPTPPTAGDNNDTFPAYAVHANMVVGNGVGGIITVISDEGKVTTSGRALQANASTGPSGGGKGGKIDVQAGGLGTPNGDVAFGTAFIQAAGDTFGGGGQAGGTIFGRSWNGHVVGTPPGELNAGGGGTPGSVTLQGCDVPPPPVNYTGTSTPPFVELPPSCGGTPPLPEPANLKLPAGDCADRCGIILDKFKSGTKFHDLNKNGKRDPGEPGLPGWTIHIFGTTAAGVPVDNHLVTDANGFYQLLLEDGTYTACEELKPGWTQSSPNNTTSPKPANDGNACETHGPVLTVGNTMGAAGYTFTISDANPQDINDDFGNFTVGECPENRPLGPKLTRCVIDSVTSVAHPTWCGLAADRRYLTVKDAYAAAGTGEVIGTFSQTTENVVLGGTKSLTIAQCTNARVTAAENGPVWTISSSGKLLVIGPDAVDGTVGWLVQTSGHELKGLRASGASQYGIQVVGNNNKVAWNSSDVNAVGVWVSGNSNDLRGGTVSNNQGDGVKITGNSNTLQGSTVQSNIGNGVFISGTGNTIKSNKASKNGGCGFLTTGPKTNPPSAPNATGNKFGSNSSNTSADGSSENTGPEYCFGVPEMNSGSNKADNVSIPTAAKCTTLFSAGGNCE